MRGRGESQESIGKREEMEIEREEGERSKGDDEI